MFKNDKLHRALNKENKFARQFIIAAILLVLVNANVIIFVLSKIDKLPMAYWVQLAFVPLLLIFMSFYYFRIHKKNIKKIHEDFEREMLSKDEK
jgi:uncharacterized BrkB/YihY/UPF0761 family membrane protein